MSDFKSGDIVELKSGGPAMTIEDQGTYSGIRKASCVWFVNMQERKEALFAVDALKKYTAPQY
ncbi:YodC family protein [Paracoccus hibiscisoli]|uniref:YodC family protein n=1 Tax=Paracoccus hibiscisoli TaxID=2023261 RepID=UPI0023F2B98F|nr:DUF2158 domain-containing protein [Paracoccus hibiscisoli]